MAGYPEFKAGQKITKMDSSFLNALVAMANAQPTPASGGADTMARPADTILVLNSTGADLDLGDPAMVIKPAVTAADDEAQFTTNLSLEAEATTTEGPGSFAVAMQPIADDTIGRMCVSGLCVATVTINHPSHGYCDISGTSLVSANAGAAQIIWQASTSGDQWCVIRLSNRYGLTADSTDYTPKPYLDDKLTGDDVWTETSVDATGGWRKVLVSHIAPGAEKIDILRLVSASSLGTVTLREDEIKFDAALHFDEVVEGGATATLYMLPAGSAVGDTLRWNGTSWVEKTFQKQVGDMRINTTSLDLEVKYTTAAGGLGAWETVTNWSGTECD